MADMVQHPQQRPHPQTRPVAALGDAHDLRERLLARRWTRGAPPAVVCIDLRAHTLGGDAAIQRLRVGVRARDIVAPLGADLFAILLDEAGSAGATAVATRLATIYAMPVGAAAREPGEDADALLQRARAACHAQPLANGASSPPAPASPPR